MAWPFSTPVVYTYDSGFAAVAGSTTPASLTANTVYIMGAHFANSNSSVVAITLTDAAGGKILDGQEIPGNGAFELPAINMMPVVGLKVGADSTGVTAKIWGW